MIYIFNVYVFIWKIGAKKKEKDRDKGNFHLPACSRQGWARPKKKTESFLVCHMGGTGHLLLLSVGTKTGDGIGHGVARTPTTLHVQCWHHRWQLCCNVSRSRSLYATSVLKTVRRASMSKLYHQYSCALKFRKFY